MPAITPFIDVPSPYGNEKSGTAADSSSTSNYSGSDSLKNLASFALGAGDVALHIDKQGMWLGNKDFTTAKTVTFAVDMNGNVFAPTITIGNTQLLDGSVVTSKLANQAVTQSKIGNLAVGTAQIANAAITNVQIASATITTANIGNAQITTALIADANITTAKIVDANITTAKIANLAVTNAQIADATIQAAKIVSLNADKITAGTLTVAVGVGNSQVNIDGANTRILINDGSFDRILIGKGVGLF